MLAQSSHLRIQQEPVKQSHIDILHLTPCPPSHGIPNWLASPPRPINSVLFSSVCSRTEARVFGCGEMIREVYLPCQCRWHPQGPGHCLPRLPHEPRWNPWQWSPGWCASGIIRKRRQIDTKTYRQRNRKCMRYWEIEIEWYRVSERKCEKSQIHNTHSTPHGCSGRYTVRPYLSEVVV